MSPTPMPPPSPRDKRRRFPLLRYFSIAAFFSILVATVALGFVYRHFAVNLLVSQAERTNVSFATLLSHTLRFEVMSLLMPPGQGTLNSLIERDGLIDAVVRTESQHFNAAKVKIYAPDGTVVYSTVLREVGTRQAGNEAVAGAMKGQVISSLVYRDQFNAFDHVIENRNLLQTYLPVRTTDDGDIVGVFELYSDMTATLHRITTTERAIMGGVGLLMLVLYAVLFAVVRRADGIIARQDEELHSHLQEIHRSNVELENRVRFRTTALEAANAKLRAEIKEREQAQRALATARQRAWQQDKLSAIGRLAAGIVHEIGNPLAGLKGLVDTAAEAFDDGESRPTTGSTLDAIRAHIERMESITRDVSGFAVPETATPEPLSLNELLQRVVKVLNYDTKFDRFRLDVNLDHQLPAIFGSTDQLWLLVMNLVLNAADAIERKPDAEPVITIATVREGEQALLTVQDNGIGMDEDAIAMAFEPFQTSKPFGEGVGLGLSLCYSIVQRHYGTISIDSEPNLGTTVRVTLPAASLPDQAAL